MTNDSSLFISCCSMMEGGGDSRDISEDVGIGASNLIYLFPFLLESGGLT
ncbi:MAG: hypothetical protein L0H53_11320 [Candidatus Nitrosocosmicus sp.]|nr:hypothetical protein [Candidatus Nitrosocosmicus sp.]MDN5868109.1 hypothetical protein [Candidatus Nitrosocosmicus sp.]